KTKLGEKKLRVRILVYADDLPAHLRPTKPNESRVSMSVPKHLAEKAARRRSREEAKPKEKILIVPVNATVRQIIEKAMDKIGITEGIVDDGGRIHDNKNNDKLLYRLMVIVDGEEKLVNPNADIVSVYPKPPDIRHFSMDSIDSASSTGLDYRPDESIFVLRLLKPEDRQQRAMPSADEVKRYTQAIEIKVNNQESRDIEEEEELSKKLLIERQRQYSKEKQNSIISSKKNQEQGVDIVTDMGAIRSSRVFGNRVRYSFISAGGDTVDISKLIEDMWGDDELLNDQMDNLSPLDQSDGNVDSLTVDVKQQRRRSTTQEVDILEKLMTNQNSGELVGNKIDQVLKKVKAGQYEGGDVPSITSAIRNRRDNEVSQTVKADQYEGDDVPSITSAIRNRRDNEVSQTLQYKPDNSIESTSDFTDGLSFTTDNNLLSQNTNERQNITTSYLENDWILSDDYGLQELLILVRSGVNMLEMKERRRSGWHLHDDPEKILERINPADIRDEIKSVFECVNDELDILESVSFDNLYLLFISAIIC
ncbi:9039_t:CDS:2, partial [Scutellospora calospora]